MIDAHAGGLGVLGALVPPLPGAEEAEADGGGDGGRDRGAGGGVSPAEMEGRMALIAGTSCCHMLSSAEPVFVPGVWGPYKSAMIPGMFLNEGGQSAAGKLLDHVTTTHAAYPELLALANCDPAKVGEGGLAPSPASCRLVIRLSGRRPSTQSRLPLTPCRLSLYLSIYLSISPPILLFLLLLLLLLLHFPPFPFFPLFLLLFLPLLLFFFLLLLLLLLLLRRRRRLRLFPRALRTTTSTSTS